MCAAILCAFTHAKERRLSRFLGIGVFAGLYLAFCIIFGNHLKHWDWFAPGACYNPQRIASPNASHPHVDRIYLGVTCFYMLGVLILCLLLSSLLSLQEKIQILPDNEIDVTIIHRLMIMVAASLQYPLHLYNVFALRASNHDLLQGDSENDWGFGQIVALIMVGQTLVECCRAVHGKYQI